MLRSALLALLVLAPTAAAQLPVNPLAGEVLVHRNVDVGARLQAWAQELPELVTVASAGQSVMGQELWTATLRAPSATDAWRVYLDGGHHGNEYFGVEFVMAYLGALVEGYRAGDEATLAFLRDHTVMALPLVNPDGNLLDTRKNANQVDLNRNYPFQWGGEGSGGSPSDGNYRGPSAGSEPETQANIAAQQAFAPDILVTMHTGIAELYWPWSYTTDPSPDEALWNGIERAVEDASNGRLDAMQGAELYLTAGSSDDYAYATLGIPAFTIEVHEDQFVPAYPGGIGPEMQDQLGGLHWLLDHVHHLGALVEVQDFRVEGGRASAVLRNAGWGEARGVTVNLTHAGQVLAQRTVDIPPGGNLTVALGSTSVAPSELTLQGSYPRLLLNTSEVGAFDAGAGSSASGAAGASVPGFELALVVLAITIALRRRT